jgi:hypothetical protein
MKARHLIGGASYGPDAIGHGRGRVRLANAYLAVALQDSHDVEAPQTLSSRSDGAQLRHTTAQQAG